MKQLSPERIWQISEEELAKLLDTNALISPSEKILFYAPSFMYYKTSHYCSSPKDFPTISITGSACALKCKHCGSKVLETMYPVLTPEELFQLGAKIKRDGAMGCLISGGCLPDGSVPIAKFVETIGKIKRELGLTVFVHTGIIDLDAARKLKDAGVDAALIDIIGSDETIKEVYNLKVTVEDYESSLKALSNANITFVPHIIVGLHQGKLRGELHALDIVSKWNPSALVVIAFMPIYGTEMATVEPPKSIDIARVTTIARLMFPDTPLVLGCMRPKGKHRVLSDILAIKAGVDAIAFPTEEAIGFAEKLGFDITFSSMCCAQIYADMRNQH